MEREGEGTKFTIDRKLFSSDIWFDSPWKLKIWIYLIGNANHKDGIYRGVKIKRGQLIRGMRTIRKMCGYKVGYRMKYPSLATVHKICEELTKDLRIERRTEHCGTLFTVLNYNNLQLIPNYEANDEANRQRTLAEHNNNDIIIKELNTSPADADLLRKIDAISETLYNQGRFKKVHAFKNKMLKEKKNTNALYHALNQLMKAPKIPNDSAWSYCFKIMQVENGNYNESEFQKRVEKQKRDLEMWVERGGLQ